TFNVHDAEIRGGGKLGFIPAPNRLELPFTHGFLDRIGITPDAPQALSLAAHGIATGRSRVSITSTFAGTMGGPRAPPPGIDMSVRGEDAAEALQAILGPRGVTVGGRGATASARIHGPFKSVQLEAEAHGLDVGAHGFQVRELGFRASAEPNAKRFRLE